MNTPVDVIVGIDPGMGGAISIRRGTDVAVFPTPLKKKKNGDKDYDIHGMAELMKPYYGKNGLVAIEAVFSMTGQGVSSSFNFGRGKGLWEGIAHAYGFKVAMVAPQTWKKHFDLIIHGSKDNKPKTEKEKKEYEKLKRQAKANAKAKARELAGTLYPKLKEEFKQVNSDGKAEAVLIAHFAEVRLEDLLNA